MTSKLKLPVESRMQGDLQVRFGGRSEKTYRRKAARRLVAPSLHSAAKLRFFLETTKRITRNLQVISK